jgi:hypothetical protein
MADYDGAHVEGGLRREIQKLFFTLPRRQPPLERTSHPSVPQHPPSGAQHGGAPSGQACRRSAGSTLWKSHFPAAAGNPSCTDKYVDVALFNPQVGYHLCGRHQCELDCDASRYYGNSATTSPMVDTS